MSRADLDAQRAQLIVPGKKNCHTCKHIEWVDGESESTTGWSCFMRQDGMRRQDEHALLQKLESDAYRARYKRCFESVAIDAARKAPT